MQATGRFVVVLVWRIMLPLGLLLGCLSSWAVAQGGGPQALAGEPLGFSGARMQQAVVTEPVESIGLFDEQYDYQPIVEPMDPDAPAPATSSGEWVRNGHWYTQQSVVYMSRSVSVKNSIRLATDFSFIGFVLPHDRSFLQVPLDMGYEPGLRSTLGRFLGRDARNRDHSVEFTYLGLTHWGATGGLTSLQGNTLFSDIDPSFHIAAFNQSNFQSFSQTSDFNSYELNYRIDRRLSRDRMVYTRDSTWVRECSPNTLPSVFAGLRVVNINEGFNWFADSTGSVPATGTYRVNTHNNLVGVQGGADWFYERSDWRLGMRGKTGAFVNWASQASHVRILGANGTPLNPNRDEFVKDHTASFIGELSFIGQYQIRPNFGLRFSYDLMWVTNLALAQNQLTFNEQRPPEISQGHSLFYQGVSVGLELLR